MVNIKRENWNHKFRVVAREKGKIITWAKWSQRFNNDAAARIFKRNNTFSETRKRTKLTKVSEIVDFSDKPVKPSADRTMMFQYFVEGIDRKRNIKIVARSRQHPVGEKASILMDEAFNNFYERYAQARGQAYDAEIGQKLFEEANASITRQGFVYYTRLIDF